MSFKRHANSYQIVYLMIISFGLGTLVNGQKDIGINKIVSPDCKDQQSHNICERMKKFGSCESRKDQMLVMCPLTCGFCREKEDICEDVSGMKCRKWVFFGACITHPDYMKKNCKRMCGWCRASTDKKIVPKCSLSPFGCCWDKSEAKGKNGKGCPRCRDRLLFCPIFYEDCVAGHNKGFMHAECPKTCRICNKQGYIPIYGI